MPNVSQLRALVAVVEIGTVTGAGAALGRTQPQVSRLITALEQAVGFGLFEREGRRLVLTQRGARFYDEAKRALDGLDNIRRVAEQIRDDAEAVLRILAPPYIAHTILPPALAKFRARHPERHYSVEVVARNAIGSWLAFHPFDIGIAALPFELPAIRVRRFAAVETVVVLPEGHPLRKKRMIHAADLVRHPFVAADRNTAIRRRLDRIFEREGIRPRIVAETTNSVSACDMAIQGVGLTIVDAVVPLTSRAPSIQCRLWKPGTTSEFGFIYPAAGPISAVTHEFSGFVAEAVGDLRSKYAVVTG